MLGAQSSQIKYLIDVFIDNIIQPLLWEHHVGRCFTESAEKILVSKPRIKALINVDLIGKFPMQMAKVQLRVQCEEDLV